MNTICNVLFIFIFSASGQTIDKESIDADLKVWHVVTKIEGKLPKCELNIKKGNFSSEVCMAIQPRHHKDNATVGFQYCDCPGRYKCSRSASLDDPFSYANIGNTQFKSCIPVHRVPICSENRHRQVAKVWYGEELPLRIVTYCRCPANSAWGELQCTSNGRICYVLSCESS